MGLAASRPLTSSSLPPPPTPILLSMPFALPSQRKAAQASSDSPSQKTSPTALPIPPHVEGVSATSDVYDDDEHEITVGQLASDEPGSPYGFLHLLGKPLAE